MKHGATSTKQGQPVRSLEFRKPHDFKKGVV